MDGLLDIEVHAQLDGVRFAVPRTPVEVIRDAQFGLRPLIHLFSSMKKMEGLTRRDQSQVKQVVGSLTLLILS